MAPTNDATVLGKVLPFSAGLLDSGWLADVEIRCEMRHWKAHKLIICGQSKWFERALTGNYDEARTGIVTITSFKCEEMAVLLKFLYTGSIQITPEFNKNHDNLFIAHMRLFHMAEYFRIPKLRDLVLQAHETHTLDCGRKLCRFAEFKDTAQPKDYAILQLVAFLEELYGKYDRHSEYPGIAAQAVKTHFRPNLMRLLMCCVPGLLLSPRFRALPHTYLEFGADWGLLLMDVVGRRGFVEQGQKRFLHRSQQQQQQPLGEVSEEYVCETCRKLVGKDDVLVNDFEFMVGGKDTPKLVCDKCFKLPSLGEWTEGVR